jgi:hypothetical protein
MHKSYTVSQVSTFRPTAIGSHRAAYLADSIPNPLAQSGQRLTLDIIRPLGVRPNGIHVQHAGGSSAINFTANDYIYTTGMANCFAVCGVWNKAGNVFQNGYLAHVSNPHQAFFSTAVGNIPAGAWIVINVGQGNWGQLIAQKLHNIFNHADDHIWIYTRGQGGNDSFGIDKFGRFGET